MMVSESGYDNRRREPRYSGRGDADDDMPAASASVAVLGLKSHRFGNISRAVLADQSCATGRFIVESLPPMNESARREIVLSPSIDPQRSREPARELKFLVPRTAAADLHRWACEHLATDAYADPTRGNAYTITSLYYDTPAFQVFHRVGSFGRSKYRIRRYDDHESIFFERKLKTNGRVSKRRTSATVQDLDRLTDGDPYRGWPGYWYHRRLLARKLRPVCQIRYRRAAWVAATPEGPIRLTLDDNLRALAISDAVFDDSSDGVPLLAEQFVLELKYRNEPPALFKEMIHEFALDTQPVSKYRLAVSMLGLVPKRETHADSTAMSSTMLTEKPTVPYLC